MQIAWTHALALRIDMASGFTPSRARPRASLLDQRGPQSSVHFSSNIHLCFLLCLDLPMPNDSRLLGIVRVHV